MTVTKALDVRGLQVSFAGGQIPAVGGVSLSLGQGKLGIVGESGSGKSTVGRALMRLLPTSATVTAERMEFDGKDLLTLPERHMRKLRGARMSFIMQDPRYSLNPVKTIGVQVAEAARLHLGHSRREAWDAAEHILERVRIRDPKRVLKAYPHQISGGMGQRVMIGMMLLAKPRLVIADEPTSALDVSVRGEVLDLLDEMVEQEGAALILISHDIRMVSAFCEQIAVMYKGRVVEDLTRLADAQHVYTRGLISAMPDPRMPTARLSVPDREALNRLEAEGRL